GLRAARARGHSRGDRRRGALPRQRRIELHHRCTAARRRRLHGQVEGYDDMTTTRTDHPHLSTVAKAAIADPGCFIDGAWETGRGPETTKLDPSTAQPLGAFRAADDEQVQRAIAAARRSFDEGVWSGRSP